MFNQNVKILILIQAICLGGCERILSMNRANENITLPDDSKNKNSSPGQLGDEGIQRYKKKSGDKGIQVEPVNPNGNPAIIIPPPIVNMPADIVPEKPTN